MIPVPAKVLSVFLSGFKDAINSVKKGIRHSLDITSKIDD